MNLVNSLFVELVFLKILRVLDSVHLKLASKFSSQLFVVPFLNMKVSLALFCFDDLVLFSLYLISYYKHFLYMLAMVG